MERRRQLREPHLSSEPQSSSLCAADSGTDSRADLRANISADRRANRSAVSGTNGADFGVANVRVAVRCGEWSGASPRGASQLVENCMGNARGMGTLATTLASSVASSALIYILRKTVGLFYLIAKKK